MSTCALGDFKLGETGLCVDEIAAQIVLDNISLSDIVILAKILPVSDFITLAEQVTSWAGFQQIVTDYISLTETILRPGRTLPVLDSITTLEAIRTPRTLKITDLILLAESIPTPPTPKPPIPLVITRPIITAERVKKLKSKFKPETVGTKLLDVQEIALQRAEKGIAAQRSITIATTTYLDSKGITGGQRANYLAFAEALWKHTQRQKGTAAQNIANGLIQYYSSTYKLNTTYLQEIAQIILGIT